MTIPNTPEFADALGELLEAVSEVLAAHICFDGPSQDLLFALEDAYDNVMTLIVDDTTQAPPEH